MIRELIQQAINKKKSFHPTAHQVFLHPNSPDQGIPTLKDGVYREISPMLAERYKMFGRWEKATHGHWLWIDFEDEPEFWVCDSNGESRYMNIKEYLEAYLSDDVSAAERTWRI